MKIGIYLGYKPEITLNTEGLGRYLGALLKSLQSNDNRIVIACHKKLKEPLRQVLEDFDIEKEDIKYITVNALPLYWGVFHVWNKIKNLLAIRMQSRFSVAAFVRILSKKMLRMTINPLSVSFIILILPFLLLAGILEALSFLGNALKKLMIIIYHSAVRKIVTKIISYQFIGTDEIVRLINFVWEDKVNLMLAKKANREKKVDVWYSPSSFWPAFNEIKGTRVTNVPDLITREFPLQWGDSVFMSAQTKNIADTIKKGKYFITYSDYVKEHICMDMFFKDRKNILAIYNKMNDLSMYIKLEDNILRGQKTGEFIHDFCRNLIQQYVVKNEYTKDCSFYDIKYIFYASQLRPHKNIFNLIKAYEYLLRKKFIREKLFLTCDIMGSPEIREYIDNNRLQNDILSFHNMPVQVLAALYSEAELAVCPTLSEGGFPFTFGESLSVDTPTVMGNIPQTTEVINDEKSMKYLFDPYNYKDIANKILYGLNHKEELLKEQKVIFDRLADRSWDDIGKEYMEAFQYFVEKDKEIAG